MRQDSHPALSYIYRKLRSFMNAHANNPAQPLNPVVRLGRAFLQWFDTSRSSSFDAEGKDQPGADRIDWMRTLPFILMHAACLFVFMVGVSPVALTVCLALY